MSLEEESKWTLLAIISTDSFIRSNNVYGFRVEIMLLCLNEIHLIPKNTSFRYYGFLIARNIFFCITRKGTSTNCTACAII